MKHVVQVPWPYLVKRHNLMQNVRLSFVPRQNNLFNLYNLARLLNTVLHNPIYLVAKGQHFILPSLHPGLDTGIVLAGSTAWQKGGGDKNARHYLPIELSHQRRYWITNWHRQRRRLISWSLLIRYIRGFPL